MAVRDRQSVVAHLALPLERWRLEQRLARWRRVRAQHRRRAAWVYAGWFLGSALVGLGCVGAIIMGVFE